MSTVSDKLSYWDSCWASKCTPWHLHKENAAMDLIPPKSLSVSATAFVPLCGKTLDMLTLLQKGYKVIGLDGIMSAAIDFFKENYSNPLLDMKHKEDYHKISINDECFVFTTPNENFRFVVCDIFNKSLKSLKFKSNILFDNSERLLIWDRGSFVAIEPSLRKEYLEQIMHLTMMDNKNTLKNLNNFIMLSEVMHHGRPSGPPYSIELTQLYDIYQTAYKSIQSQVTSKSLHSDSLSGGGTLDLDKGAQKLICDQARNIKNSPWGPQSIVKISFETR